MTACLLLANVLLSVHGPAVNLNLYRYLWVKYDVPADTGMTMDDLAHAGETLVGYFTGKLESPQVTPRVFGENRPLYNPEEITHLEDVKHLFGAGLTAEWISIAAAFSGTMLLMATKNRKAASRALYAAGAISILVLVLLAIPAASDFTSWWTDFHLVTFTNDLWRLNPDTDWLLKMFPEGFFFSMVERIGVHAGVTALALILTGYLIGRERQARPKRSGS